MNYSQFSPIWIINTLVEEDSIQFEKRISQQLLAYSQNEIGISFNPDDQRWWKIDRVNVFNTSLIDDKKHPKDIPAYSLTKNKLDETYLMVVILGSLSTFESANNIAKALKKAKDEAQFMQGAGIRVNYYGLFSYENGQNYNAQLDETIRNSDFDTVFLQGTNNNTEENAHGYHNLNKKDDSNNYWDLSVQIIHHLYLTKDRLNYFNDSKLHIVGASSIIFEPEGEKKLCAAKLTNRIVKKFKTESEGNHWHDKKKATLSDTFKDFHGWRNIYNELKGGYENLPTDNLHIASKVSPWNLFLKILIKEYYKKYIKSVVRLIHENVIGFSLITMRRYENHLDNKYALLTGDKRLDKAIEDELCSIWDKRKNEEADCAIGFQQFKSKLDEMLLFFTSQKNSINDLKDQTAPDAKNSDFPRNENYPLGVFGDLYQKRCEEYIEKGDDGQTGDAILQKLTRVLQFHPVPLSLLARAILLGVLLPMCVLTILKIIPDNILNTAVVESQPGSIYLVAGCFATCVLIAFLRYLFNVIDYIRVKIRDYIAWSLYKLQQKVYTMTLDKTADYFASAIGTCNTISERIAIFDKLGEEELEDDELKDADYLKYHYNSFQLNVMRTYEGFKILKNDSIDHRYMVRTPSGNELVIIENDTDDVHFKIFRDAFIFGNNEVRNILYSLFFNFAEETDCHLFDVTLQDAIKKKLDVYVHSTPISTLSDVLFETGENRTNGNNNMAIHPENGYNESVAKYLKVMSYPSGNAVVAYHYISYVIPQSDMYNVQSWDELFGLSHRLSDALGSFTTNVLQGLAVSSLKDIKDIKVVEDHVLNNEM